MFHVCVKSEPNRAHPARRCSSGINMIKVYHIQEDMVNERHSSSKTFQVFRLNVPSIYLSIPLKMGVFEWETISLQTCRCFENLLVPSAEWRDFNSRANPPTHPSGRSPVDFPFQNLKMHNKTSYNWTRELELESLRKFAETLGPKAGGWLCT